MQVQELVGLVPWTFIAQICNLFIQAYLIKKFLLKPVNEMLEKRRAKANAEIEDATKARLEAEEMKASYEENMHRARLEASEIVTAAQKNAAAKSEEILREAASQAAAIKNKAEADIAREKAKAVNDIKNEIGGMSVDIAEKVVGREIREEDHRALIDSFIENL